MRSLDAKKILLVDDEKELAEMVGSFLAEKGYQVDLAFDGEEGFNKAKSEKPDLIILDVKLPKKDGYEVCEDLRDLEETKHIPIMMLTARNSTAEENIGFAAGADDYLKKPYDLDILLHKVKELLNKVKV
jgi:two-component system response regulator VicR